MIYRETKHRPTDDMGGDPTFTPRRFTDCVGTSWTVYEVHHSAAVDRASHHFPHQERRGGWLLFESTEMPSRRLAPFPADWRLLSEFELERWCMRAIPVDQVPARRRDDRKR